MTYLESESLLMVSLSYEASDESMTVQRPPDTRQTKSADAAAVKFQKEEDTKKSAGYVSAP